MGNNKKKRFQRPYLILHVCYACDNKWESKFEVKTCFKCGLHESGYNGIPGIWRKKVFLKQYSDGNWYIPLTLKKVVKSEEKRSECN